MDKDFRGFIVGYGPSFVFLNPILISIECGIICRLL